MRLRLVTAPSAKLMTLAEAKAQLRVDYDDDDDFIDTLIDAATAKLDGRDGAVSRALTTQTWALDLDRFPSRGESWWSFLGRSDRAPAWPLAVHLPLGVIASVDSVVYYDDQGTQQTLSSSAYVAVTGEDGLINPAPGAEWPCVQRDRPLAATIQFTAGYGADAGAVPAPLKHAAKLLVSHWYANRDAVVGVDNRDSSAELPLGVESLIAPYRTWSVQ